MNRPVLFIALILLATLPASAHRLDEYLQATIISIEPGHIQASMRLVSGAAVAPQIIANIDINNDGVFSRKEESRYADKVLSDLRLEKDGQVLQPHLLSAVFPTIAQMREGTGEIELTFVASYQSVRGEQQLIFENHHDPAISVYLVNSLVPSESTLQIESQDRNQSQAVYRVAFTRIDSPGGSQAFTWSGFNGAFRLGARHIAKGTDHLLFLLTLLLPAPLLAVAGRWRERAPIRRTTIQILRIVTAFTLGHSFTLALSGFGLLRLPGRPVEVLIAGSIFVSAIHAMRPLFPGREALVAGFFGLMHGLAFASALNELGVTGWYRLVSLFGFNLGIEAMQLVVVVITMPAFVLLSRTDHNRPFRIVGAAVALLASTAWIIERVTERLSSVGALVEQAGSHGITLAVSLWIACLLAWAASGSTSTTRNGVANTRGAQIRKL